MGRLRPEDFRLDEPTPFVAVPRGKGGRLAAVPLVGEGLEALGEFMAVGAYGSWSCPSANRALALAVRKAGRQAIERFAASRPGAGGRSGEAFGWQYPLAVLVKHPQVIDSKGRALSSAG